MTSPIMVLPEVLATGAATETAGVATMGGATGATGPNMTVVVPPGIDDASIAAAAALVGRGATSIAMMTQLMVVRSLFADTIAANGVGYVAVDGIQQATLAI